jgi:hypothetical protein
MKVLFLLITTWSIFVVPGLSDTTGVPVDASKIIQNADRARGNLEGVVWTADIRSTENGEVAERTLTIKNRGVNSLAEFTAPAKVSGQKLLMLDRNMWFIKPGLQKPVPISARQKLMGGAANGDIASTNYAQDYHAQANGEEIVAGQTCFVFELKASNPKVTYDRIRYWISKEHELGVQAEFYTVSGKMLKTARFKYDNKVRVEGVMQPFMSEMEIQDGVEKENITVMSYRDIKVEVVPESVFNLNLLVR